MTKSLILKSEFLLENRMKDRSRLISKKSSELDQVETDLRSLEEKWIMNQIGFDTYNRWYGDYTKQLSYLRAQLSDLKKQDDATHTLLIQTIHQLSDLRHVFDTCNAVQKQELVRTVFDNSLYYENKVYRTPYLIPEFTHNHLIMKEKNLLIWEKKRGNFTISPSGGAEGSITFCTSHIYGALYGACLFWDVLSEKGMRQTRHIPSFFAVPDAATDLGLTKGVSRQLNIALSSGPASPPSASVSAPNSGRAPQSRLAPPGRRRNTRSRRSNDGNNESLTRPAQIVYGLLFSS
jgi:hypothetical protein